MSIGLRSALSNSDTAGFIGKLRSQGSSFLGWSSVCDSMVVGYLARAGYDAILLDQQHGFHDTASCIARITEASLAGTPTLVRVRVGDFAEASRMLDLGAAGVVAPMINSPDDARLFVSQTKFPPMGQRSFGPGRAMQLRGLSEAGVYADEANATALAIAMCETKEAYATLDEILDVPGVDGILIGPADLSMALSGGQLDSNSGQVRAAMSDIARRTRAVGKIACAFAGSLERSRELAAEGFNLVSVAYDEKLIAEAFSNALKQVSCGGGDCGLSRTIQHAPG